MPIHVLGNIIPPIPLAVDIGRLPAVVEGWAGLIGGDRRVRGFFGGPAAVGGMLGGVGAGTGWGAEGKCILDCIGRWVGACGVLLVFFFIPFLFGRFSLISVSTYLGAPSAL